MRSSQRICQFLLLCLAGVFLSASASAQDLAQLGSGTITLADVDFQLGRRPGADLPELPPAILNSTIDLIASQRLALASLRNMNVAASDDVVDRWLEANPPPTNNPDYKLSAEEIVSAICKETKMTAETYRSVIAFRLSWPLYLKKLLTDENVEKHFRKQTARFDGTLFEVEIASLAASAGESESRESAEAKLLRIKGQLAPDMSDFGVVAKADREIEYYERRWIRGTGDLDPKLIDTILTMKTGELSAPAHSAAGVHLIHLIDKKSGDRQLSEVRDEVRAHMLIFLLNHLALKSAEAMPLKSKQ
jgi:hypothetical protein